MDCKEKILVTKQKKQFMGCVRWECGNRRRKKGLGKVIAFFKRTKQKLINFRH